ncbi:MAG: hypothetical protein AB1938_02555 [Myxococcota bacterium]
MALREEQVQRYGRQILLREVGGKGQERLLHAPVRVEGRSAAIDVAVSVLAAGGTPVVCEPPPGDGYLAGASWDDFNPDARAVDPPFASLAPADFRAELLPHAVLVGGQGAVYRFQDAAVGPCPDCLEATLASVRGPATRSDEVLLGSLAALLLQRLALGLSLDASVPHAFRLLDGALSATHHTPCRRHPSGN